jgi:hypothetical protein
LEQRDEVVAGDRRVQLWALFDRDQHQDIPQAMRDARDGGVRVAFSHPSFDLWLLLHFTSTSGQQGGSSRIVHQKLRQCAGFETFDSHNDKSVTGQTGAGLARQARGRRQTGEETGRRLSDRSLFSEQRARDALRSAAPGPINRCVAASRRAGRSPVTVVAVTRPAWSAGLACPDQHCSRPTNASMLTPMRVTCTTSPERQ